METTTWMLEEVQKQVNQERWDGASWCRRQTTRQLEKSAWVLEKLFMEEEGSHKLGKKNYGVIREEVSIYQCIRIMGDYIRLTGCCCLPCNYCSY